MLVGMACRPSGLEQGWRGRCGDVPTGVKTFMKRSVVSGQAMGLAHVVAGSPAKTLREVRASVEREIILAALGRHGWKIAPTATELKISRSTIYIQLDVLG